MEYKQLGSSSLVLSRLSFGCEPLGGTDWGELNEQELARAVAIALERGINFFDTADVYGLGRSEEELAKLLGPKRHQVVIATKGGMRWYTKAGKRAQIVKDSSPAYIQQAVEASLRRLQLDIIPLYQIHWPDPETAIEATVETLFELQHQQKIQHIGCSNFDVALLEKAQRVAPISSVQVPYNYINRAIEQELLPYCAENNISVLVYSPLARGLLTGKYNEKSSFPLTDRRHRLEEFQGENFKTALSKVEELRHLANDAQMSVSQIALQWLLNSPQVTSVITGIKSSQQILENIAVCS